MAKDVKIQASKYLEAHTLIDKVYSTSDGFLFETKQHAIQHGVTLEDKNVETHVRIKDGSGMTVGSAHTISATDEKTSEGNQEAVVETSVGNVEASGGLGTEKAKADPLPPVDDSKTSEEGKIEASTSSATTKDAEAAKPVDDSKASEDVNTEASKEAAPAKPVAKKRKKASASKK